MKCNPAPLKRMADWVGRKARTRRELRSASQVIPAGATVMVSSTVKPGLWIESDPCPHCGVRMCMSRVFPSDLELLP